MFPRVGLVFELSLHHLISLNFHHEALHLRRVINNMMLLHLCSRRMHSHVSELIFKLLVLVPELMELAMERFVVLFDFNLDHFNRFSKSYNFFV